ncbi:hypothetical protein FOA52_010014 [Chlamydomonas sp. UWO 241]|nr:hypothetical protein FOA52_010014 [Chlamydomonas sp. UWO 241]
MAAATDLDQTLLDLLERVLEANVDIDLLYRELQDAGPADQVYAALVEVSWLQWVRLEGSANSQRRLRLVEILQACVKDKKIDRRLAMEVFEHDCMQASGLLNDKELEVWKRKEVRFNTKTAYTQSKFNLLREDSEGYAKLIACVNHFGEAALTHDTVPLLFQEVQALIGYFDLDPNRVLDLVLEAGVQQPGNAGYVSLVPLFKAEAVVHLLGFKFQHYQRNGGPAAPDKLYAFAAHLVSVGQVSLEGLCGHLSPSNATLRREQAAAGAAMRAAVDDIGTVSLTSAAVDALPARNAADGKGDEAFNSSGLKSSTKLSSAAIDLDASSFRPHLLHPRPEGNQKLGLALALVARGDLDSAGVLMDSLEAGGLSAPAWPPMAAALCAALAPDVEAACAVIAPKGLASHCALDSASASRAGDAVGAPPPLTPRAVQLLLRLGMFLYTDVVLLTRVIRVLRYQLQLHCADALNPDGGAPSSSAQAAALRDVENVLTRCVLPSTQLVPSNAALASELWCLLSMFPYHSRFRFYQEAKELTERSAFLSAASKLATREVRKVLKRLARPERDEGGRERRETKEAMKPYARMLAKAAHACPTQVAELLIQLAESYSNQIEPISDALRYVTPLAFDVLTYCILARMALDRPKIKDDGINICDWLQNLSTFNAAVCRKYPDMEISAMCQMLSNALRAGDAFDLLVLKDLNEVLTGIVVHSEVSEKQLEGLAGGPELRERAIVSSSEERERSMKAWARGGRRLLSALQRGRPERHLALPLLVLIAQQRHVIATQTESKHVKLIAEMYDRCQETCKQYIRFLQNALPEDEYARLLPPIDVQRREYGLDPEVVFTLYRPLLRRLLFLTCPLPEDGELEEGEDAAAASAVTTAPASAASASTAVVESTEPPKAEPEFAGLTWSSLVDSMRASMPNEGVWAALATEVYSTFWTLDTSDIYVPTKRYHDEIAAVESEIAQADRQINASRSPYAPPGMMGYGGGGGSSAAADALETLRRNKSNLVDLLAKLKAELDSQIKHVGEVRARLDRDKETLFGGAGKKSGKCNILHASLVEECILPRMLFSPEDALYCAKFPALLHQLDTPYFSTLLFYNELLRTVPHVLKCVTTREGANMGIFLRECFQLLSHWRSSEEVYKKDAEACVGFAVSFSDLTSCKKTSYEQYTKLMHKWHLACCQIFQSCLRNEEWTSRRNALSVLTSVVEYFPVVTEQYNALKKLVEGMRDTETREDLKKLAQGYLSLLEREGAKPDRLVPSLQWGGIPPKQGVRKASAVPTTAGASASSALRPDARAFQPKPTDASGRAVKVEEGSAAGAQKRARHADGGGGGVDGDKDAARTVKTEGGRNGDDKERGGGGDKDKDERRDGGGTGVKQHVPRKRLPDAPPDRVEPHAASSRDPSRDRSARDHGGAGGAGAHNDAHESSSKRRRAEAAGPAAEGATDLRSAVLSRSLPVRERNGDSERPTKAADGGSPGGPRAQASRDAAPDDGARPAKGGSSAAAVADSTAGNRASRRPAVRRFRL